MHVLLFYSLCEHSGILATYPATSDLNSLLVEPLQMIVEVFSSVVQPLAGGASSEGLSVTRPTSDALTETYSTLPNSYTTPSVHKDIKPQDVREEPYPFHFETEL